MKRSRSDADATDGATGSERLAAERFELAARLASDVIYEWNVPDNSLRWFGDVDGLLGYEPGAAPQTIEGWAAAIHPDERRRFLEAVRRHRSETEPIDEAYRIGHRDGGWRHWVVRAIATVGENGRPVRWLGVVRDVTEQREAEEALRQSELKYRSLVESAGVAIIHCALDGEMLFVNATGAAYLGERPADLVGKSLTALLAPYGGGTGERLGEVARAGRGSEYEDVLALPDGQRCFRSWYEPLRDDSGEVVAIQIVSHDVTEGMRAAQELRETEERFSLIANNVRDVIWTADLGLRFTYVSPSIEQLRGFTPEEALQQSLGQMLSPESAKEALRIFAAEMQRQEQGQSTTGNLITFEAEQPHKDGSTIITETQAGFMRDSADAVVGILGVSRDITEKKRLQDALAAAKLEWERTFDAISDAITIHDRDLELLQANRAAAALLDEQLEELLTRDDYGFAHGGGEDSEHRDGEATETELVRRVLHRDRQLEIQRFPRRDEEGATAGYIHVIRDVTAEAEAARKERVLQGQLAHSERLSAIGQLAGGVAHDFSNQLTVILSCAEGGLMVDDLDAMGREAFAEISTAARKAAVLTRQLLAFGRKQVLNVVPVGLDDLTSDVSRMLRRLLPEHVGLAIRIGQGMLTTMADRSQLEQVLVNLVVNARDAVPDGGRIDIRVGSVELDESSPLCPELIPAGGYVTLKVADNGHGMPPEVLRRAFDPFYTTKATGEGTGLGLATVYGIIKQHGGHIDAHSEVGVGSTFTVYLPAHEPAPEEPEDPSTMPLPRGNEVVWLVDDEPSVLALLEMTLQTLGYRTTAALSAEELLDHAGDVDVAPDLLVTDAVLVGMNGWELSEKLRWRFPGLKVLFVSGYSADILADQGLDPHGAAFLGKPVAPRELAFRVRQLLDE